MGIFSAGIFSAGFFSSRRRARSPECRRKGERGNALFYILICIVLLGLMTSVVIKAPTSSVDAATETSQDEQITRLLSYAGTLASAINQMVLQGANPSTLFSTLDITDPSGASFNTAPYALKIFHPLGGGITQTSSTSFGADAVANTFRINRASIVTDIGPTNATTGDILFTANITSLAVCQRINMLLWGSATVPALTTANFTTLFTTATAVTLAAGNCAGCVGKAQICVSNTANTAWGYYAALLPQ